MISFEEAFDIVLNNIKVLDSEGVGLPDALGRYTANDVLAGEDSPPFDNSAMDGFAVRYEDVKDASSSKPARLKVVGNIPAGNFAGKACEKGKAMRIMTGAPMPVGADTVIPVEATRTSEGFVEIFEPLPKGKYVRLKGGDVKVDDVICQKGSLIRPQEQALLASIGRYRFDLIRRPQVAILSTGSELVDIDEIPERGKIRDVNSLMLSSLVKRARAKPLPIERVYDDLKVIENRINSSFESSDVLVTSGGVSVGDHDHVKEALERAGVEILFWRVRMKPGKPLLFGKKGNKVVFGLPGNPVSSFVGFELFINPALKKMSGARNYNLEKKEARLFNRVVNDSGRDNFMRGYLFRDEDNTLSVKTFAKQESNMLESLCKANALVRIPAEKVEMERSEKVSVYLLDNDPLL